jgi:hypothetical protein
MQFGFEAGVAPVNATAQYAPRASGMDLCMESLAGGGERPLLFFLSRSLPYQKVRKNTSRMFWKSILL